MQIVGIGSIVFFEGGCLWIGCSKRQVEPHAHHAIQVTLGLSGPVRIRNGQNRWKSYHAVMVPSGLAHEFEAMETIVAHLLVAPESAAGLAIAERFGAEKIVGLPHVPQAESLFALFAAGAPPERLVTASRASIEFLTNGVAPTRVLDRRVKKAIGEIRQRLGGAVALNEIAAAVSLSPGRFRHLFAAETGVPFRRYVLWLRLEEALAAALDGASWTESAYLAGFADSAHLSRTLRRMLGIPPSAIR